MSKSGIHINPKNKGKFTKTAHSMGLTPYEAATKIMGNPQNYSRKEVERANFAKNARKFKH